MIRAILSLLLTLVSLAIPTAALAQEAKQWSQSGNWLIYREDGQSCYVVNHFVGDWVFGVAITVERKAISILAGPFPYKLGDNPPLSWEMGGTAFNGGNNVVSKGGDRLRILSLQSNDFMEKFEAATVIQIYDEDDDSKVIGFDLVGAGPAVAELRRCTAELIKADTGSGLPATVKPVLTNTTPLITPDDYPGTALRNQVQGRTSVTLTTSAHGLPLDCLISVSSGNVDLDNATCSILKRRARFTPAKDAAGNATMGRYDTALRWTLPQD